MDIDITPINNSDLADVIKLLNNNNLPTIDIANSSIHLFVGKYNNEIVGVIGIEIYKTTGLLRSLAVEDSFKKLKIGTKLIRKIFNHSLSNNIADVYLLTETAPDYFKKFSFDEVDRSSVPDIIMQTQEFKEICPDTAIVMHKNLIK